jgi:hypothetical protein
MSTYHVHISWNGNLVESDLPEEWKIVRRADLIKMQDAVTLLSELDRCSHGRHRGDVCGGASGCNGPSVGNGYLSEGQRIGTTLSGHAITVPDQTARVDLGDASLWVRP